MKIAAGCFGCLAFIFFIAIWITGPIIASLATASPDVYQSLAPVVGYVSYVNYSCCCLSALLAIVFLAVGMMGGKKEQFQ